MNQNNDVAENNLIPIMNENLNADKMNKGKKEKKNKKNIKEIVNEEEIIHNVVEMSFIDASAGIFTLLSVDFH